MLIRGGGIVASRVLQRLIDDRLLHGAQTTDRAPLPHLHHGANDGYGNEPAQLVMRAPAARDGWAYQGFNYPKSVWGGQLKQQMRKLEGEERAELYKRMGGTNTP